MHKTTFGIFLLLLIGCKNFETKKVSSETILQQKLEHFNWNEVDAFPTFENCQHLMEQLEKKRCFENTFTKLIYEELSEKPIVLGDSVRAKVVLHLLISAKGDPKIDSIVLPPNLQKKIPGLEARLRASIDSLPKIHPATTRGIPVATKFTLPIHVVSE